MQFTALDGRPWCVRSVHVIVPDLKWQTDVETTSHFSRNKYVSLCQSGTDGSQWSSPAAAAATTATTLMICEREAPQVTEADP